jgi:anaerobic dimethyl sulfoxide reductase subunit C (anchor subunit)
MNVREWALPVYTILMQLATGTFFVIWAIRSVSVSEYGRDKVDQLFKNSILVVFFTTGVAMSGAHFHLSKPYLSFLSVLNFHTSWLSREIIFTVLFFMSVGSLSFLRWHRMEIWRLKTIVGWIAVFFGWVTVYCMAKVYILPTQIAWNSSITIISFIFTTLLLGIIALNTLLIMDLKYSEFYDLTRVNLYGRLIQKLLSWFVFAAILIVAVLISMNLYQVALLDNNNHPTAQASLKLLLHLYPVLFGMRLGLTMFGVGFMAVVTYIHLHSQKPIKDLLLPAYITCLFVLVGEILGRFLFYAIHVRIGI